MSAALSNAISDASPRGSIEGRPLGTMLIIRTILCLGLNLLIHRISGSRYARFALALLILNEIRGVYVVYLAADRTFAAWPF